MSGEKQIEGAKPALHCPICRKPVAFDSPEMPFCSERCRIIDLGAWASEEYRISTPGGRDIEDEFGGE